MGSRRFWLSVLAVGLVGHAGCGGGGDDDGLGISKEGRLELDPSTSIRVSAGQAAVGGKVDLPVRVINVGQGPLEVTSVEFVYADGGSDDLGAAFALSGAPTQPFRREPIGAATGQL